MFYGTYKTSILSLYTFSASSDETVDMETFIDHLVILFYEYSHNKNK